MRNSFRVFALLSGLVVTVGVLSCADGTEEYIDDDPGDVCLACPNLFILKTAKTGLTTADYNYLSLIPASKHANKGVPAIVAIADDSDLGSDIYLQDYLQRYKPVQIYTVNFTAAIPNTLISTITATGSLELSVAMATSGWSSSKKVVLVSDAVDDTNYPNVLQASALASVLGAPLMFFNADSAKSTLVRDAINQLGATEVIYVNAAGTKPDMANLVLKDPVTIVNYLAGKNIKVDYFAATNPKDLNLASGAKLSLTAPFVAARRTGIVVPITSYVPLPNSTESFHYTGYPAIQGELQQLYQAIGRYPGYLALVGNATSIPLSYRAPNEQAGQYYNSPADLDYSNVDADPFPDIAIGRIMAYDIFDATLLSCRISTYEQLFDEVWEKTMADVGGQWNSAFQDALGQNYGFGSTNLVGILGPTQPVEAAIIGHNDHSSYHVLGGAFDVNSVNVLAPAFIASEGCATASIDFETLSEDGGGVVSDRGFGLLVVNRLFKLGAVAFVGATRVNPGPVKMMQSAAVNALLAGEPLGRAYMAGVDTFSWNGIEDQRWNWILLGDPGLKIHVPEAPVVAPASYVVTAEAADTDTLTVNLPSTLFTPEVDQSWCSHWGLAYPQYWGEKAGLYGMDVDRFYMVRFAPSKPVLGVEELDTWPTVNVWVWGDVKLGMMGPPAIDFQPDGSTQLVWAIRANIMDWAGSGGKVPLAEMTKDRFRITYLPYDHPNVAVGKLSRQSSNAYSPEGEAPRAVDGNTNGNFGAGSVTHTNSDPNAWWQVDLGAAHQIDGVVLWNRTDCCGERLSNFHVDFLNSNGDVLLKKDYSGTAGPQILIDAPVSGVWSVRVQLYDTGILSLAEVGVFGKPQ